MALSEKQKELLKEIQNRLQRGDIKDIAKKTNISREHVGRALNITTDYFNEDVVEAAMHIILTREANAKKNLQKLNPEPQPATV